jgi:peptide deformylase
MVETMIDSHGAGLAAPQVHEQVRLVIFQAQAGRADPGHSETEAFDHTAPLTVLANPVVEVLSNETEGGWEGCLSVPGLRGWVERPCHIRYRGTGLDGHVIERVAKGFHARVVQHECDHLDGILYPQRMTDLTKLIFESETKHWLEQKD